MNFSPSPLMHSVKPGVRNFPAQYTPIPSKPQGKEKSSPTPWNRSLNRPGNSSGRLSGGGDASGISGGGNASCRLHPTAAAAMRPAGCSQQRRRQRVERRRQRRRHVLERTAAMRPGSRAAMTRPAAGSGAASWSWQWRDASVQSLSSLCASILSLARAACCPLLLAIR
jgi:hypothetical protein